MQKRDILWRNVKWDISIWKVMGFKKISHRHFIGRNVPRSMVTAMHNSIWGGSMKMESLFQKIWKLQMCGIIKRQRSNRRMRLKN